MFLEWEDITRNLNEHNTLKRWRMIELLNSQYHTDHGDGWYRKTKKKLGRVKMKQAESTKEVEHLNIWVTVNIGKYNKDKRKS